MPVLRRRVAGRVCQSPSRVRRRSRRAPCERGRAPRQLLRLDPDRQPEQPAHEQVPGCLEAGGTDQHGADEHRVLERGAAPAEGPDRERQPSSTPVVAPGDSDCHQTEPPRWTRACSVTCTASETSTQAGQRSRATSAAAVTTSVRETTLTGSQFGHREVKAVPRPPGGQTAGDEALVQQVQRVESPRTARGSGERRSRAVRFRRLDAVDPDVADQHRVRRNPLRHAAVAVPEVRGDADPTVPAGPHADQRVLESRDDPALADALLLAVASSTTSPRDSRSSTSKSTRSPVTASRPSPTDSSSRRSPLRSVTRQGPPVPSCTTRLPVNGSGTRDPRSGSSRTPPRRCRGTSSAPASRLRRKKAAVVATTSASSTTISIQRDAGGVQAEEEQRPERVQRELRAPQPQRPAIAGRAPHAPGRDRHAEVEHRPDGPEDPVRRVQRWLAQRGVPVSGLERGPRRRPRAPPAARSRPARGAMRRPSVKSRARGGRRSSATHRCATPVQPGRQEVGGSAGCGPRDQRVGERAVELVAGRGGEVEVEQSVHHQEGRHDPPGPLPHDGTRMLTEPEQAGRTAARAAPRTTATRWRPAGPAARTAAATPSGSWRRARA